MTSTPYTEALADRVANAWYAADCPPEGQWTAAGDEQPYVRRCQGAGEIEVGTKQDEFGNWDTETYVCPGCPDCLPCPECGGSGSGEIHPGANVPAPCGACNGTGLDGR